ncbi:hypothetical protein MASR2M78_21030 [Treponema sp.]
MQIEQAREHDIDLISSDYLVAVIQLSASSTPEWNKAKFIIKSLLDRQGDVLSFSPSLEKMIFILKKAAQESLEEMAYSVAQAVKYEVERNTDCLISVGIGSAVFRIAEIPFSYAAAEKNLKHLAMTGQNLIIGVPDLQFIEGNKPLQIEGDPITERLKYARKSDIEGIILEYFNLFGENTSQQAIVAYYLFGEIIAAISSLVGELGGDIDSLLPQAFDKRMVAEIVETRESFKRGIRSILETVIDYRDSLVKSRYHVMITQAKLYIDSHYADQDISLHSVSSFVNISPNHFSTIFSQETGETFIEYLTGVRISRAKFLLMSTTERSSDIAYEVGFGDPHYFSFIFKKHTGISPRDFRSGNKGS